MGSVLPLNCRCLEPRKVFNPYSRDTLVVPCGHCKACILNKNSRLAFQCDLEALSNKYCMFITLTYANRYIPRANFIDAVDRPFGCDLFDKQTGEILGSCDMLEDDRERLLNKFYLFGDVPYLRKIDLQNFFKRFRYYAGKITKERVRYFAVGEYGPVHFRPHYHVLLYFNSEQLLQACSEIVCSSWTFGRVDCQISKGKCSSYVANYINSSVSVPKIFTLPSTRGFCLHSQKLGQGVLRCEREKVYSLTASEFIKRSVVFNGDYREFRLWRSCYRYFYPKCKGFSDKSARELSYSYRLYDTAKELFPYCETASDLSREIASCIRLFGPSIKGLTSDVPVSDVSKLNDLCSYFYSSDSDSDVNSDLFQRWVNRIYIELLTSKHFLYYVCDHPSTYEINRKIRLIQEFYKQLDYLRLTDFFENQSQYYESDFVGDEPLLSDAYNNSYCPYFYDNVNYSIESYKELVPYKLFCADILKLSQDRIKHKYLNDKNKIFFDC